MKLIATTLIALFISVSAFAQQDFLRNEISVNWGTTVFALYPEISFERLLAEEIGIGASLGFGTGDSFMNFNFTPYFRMYFGNLMFHFLRLFDNNRDIMPIAGTGFFIEANTSLFSFRYDWWEDFYNEGYWHWGDRQSENRFDFGVGLGIGWKWLTRNNWSGEVLLGAGRGFINDYSFYPRFGLSIGRRF